VFCIRSCRKLVAYRCKKHTFYENKQHKYGAINVEWLNTRGLFHWNKEFLKKLNEFDQNINIHVLLFP